MALRGLRIWTHFKKRWVRRMFFAGGLLLLLALLLCLLPSLVNKRNLRATVRDWTVARLENSCPASVGGVDLALRINGRTDLYVHDYELDSPNPRFDLPWLYVDTFRASAPMYTLLGGIPADPVVQVRDGVLRLVWDSRDHFNLSGLALDSGGWTLPFMRHMEIGTIDFQLMKCRVIFSRPDLSGQLRLDGHLRVDANRSRLDFLSQEGIFELKTPSGRELLPITCSLSRAEYDRRQQRLTALTGAVKNVPLRLATLLVPELPLKDAAATATGAVSGDGRRWTFDGQIRGLGLTEFSDELGAQFGIETDEGNGQTVRLELRELIRRDSVAIAGAGSAPKILPPASGAPAFALAARRDGKGSWQGVSAYCARLDLDALAAGKEHPWLDYLAGNFRSARIEGDQVRLAGLELGKVSLDILSAPERTVNVSLSGEIAGGRLALLARQIPLNGGGRPRTVLGSLHIPNAADTILRFSGLLPPVLQCSPVSGSGELTIKYDAAKRQTEPEAPGASGASDKRDARTARDAAAVLPALGAERTALKTALQEAAFVLRLDLQNVRLPALTGGALIQELAGLPRRMVELENLCRRAQIKEQPALALPSDGWEHLEFSALQISYDIAPGGRQQLRSIIGVSPQLGRIEGSGTQGEDGTLRLRFVVKDLPAATGTENPDLSASVRAALARVIGEQGLRIDCLISEKPGTSKVEAPYVQEVFRVWSESAGKAAAGTSGGGK